MAVIPLSRISATSVETLLDRAFGMDRRLRTAYRVRAGASAIDELSFAAVDDSGYLLGSIQCFPVQLDCDDGTTTPMIMVGPVAVEPAIQQQGLGRLLTQHMIAAADSSEVTGADTLMLIGDPEYYGRFFGFTAERTAGWRLPGPFEPRRLLARGAVPACAGMLGPRAAILA